MPIMGELYRLPHVKNIYITLASEKNTTNYNAGLIAANTES